MSIVLCKLPKAGLGNQLFPLVKASVFSELNQLPLFVTNYNQVSLGAYLRREKSKRNYSGYFNFQKGIIAELAEGLRLLKYKHYDRVNEPVLQYAENPANTKSCFYFSAMPHWDDYFGQLKQNRELALKMFWSLLKPGIIRQLEKLDKPVIGVHIRMGDFRKLHDGEDFKKVGAVRTPEDYFKEVIEGIRRVHGSDLPVSVFTDGYRGEFSSLFNLNNISMVEGNSDITDMLLLSKSKVIVTSAGSTFSYWSAFLSDAPVIMHPDHIHQPLRPSEMGGTVFEGAFDANDPVLVNNIKSIL